MNVEKNIMNLQIMCLNVHGLMSKLMYCEFWNYINKFDVVILIETWIEKEFDFIFGKYLKKI